MVCFKFIFQEDSFSCQGTEELEVDTYDFEDEAESETVRERAWMTRPAQDDEKTDELAPEESGEVAL